jgi:hypothetical protein
MMDGQSATPFSSLRQGQPATGSQPRALLHGMHIGRNPFNSEPRDGPLRQRVCLDIDYVPGMLPAVSVRREHTGNWEDHLRLAAVAAHNVPDWVLWCLANPGVCYVCNDAAPLTIPPCRRLLCEDCYGAARDRPRGYSKLVHDATSSAPTSVEVASAASASVGAALAASASVEAALDASASVGAASGAAALVEAAGVLRGPPGLEAPVQDEGPRVQLPTSVTCWSVLSFFVPCVSR